MQELGNFFIGKSFGRKKQKENALRFLSERFPAKTKPPRKILEGF